VLDEEVRKKKKGGVIIQHIKNACKVTTCDCPPVDIPSSCLGNAAQEYWEAWLVEPDGTIRPAVYDTWQCRQQDPGQPNKGMNCGTRGEAWFVEGMTEERLKELKFTKDNKKTSAGDGQYSTTEAPDFAKDEQEANAVKREVKANWSCCPGDKDIQTKLDYNGCQKQ
jgi:hypothetical protein